MENKLFKLEDIIINNKIGYKKFNLLYPNLLDEYIKLKEHNPTNKEMYFKNLRRTLLKKPSIKDIKEIKNIAKKTLKKQEKQKGIRQIKVINEIQEEEKTIDDKIKEIKEQLKNPELTKQEKEKLTLEHNDLFNIQKKEYVNKKMANLFPDISYKLLKQIDNIDGDNKEAMSFYDNLIEKFNSRVIYMSSIYDIESRLKYMTIIEKEFNILLKIQENQLKLKNRGTYIIKNVIESFSMLSLKQKEIKEIESTQENNYSDIPEHLRIEAEKLVDNMINKI